MDKIEIPLNKLKLFLISAGAVLFVILGVLIIQNYNNHESIFLLLTGIISILFFGLISVTILIKLFDNKPGLIIDEKEYLIIQAE